MARRKVDPLGLALAILEVMPFPFGFGGTARAYRLVRRALGQTDIEDDIERTVSALRAAAKLTESLKVELEQSNAELAKVFEEYETYSQLAGTEKEKAGALLKQIRSEARRQTVWGLGANLAIGLLIFGLGLLVGGVTV